MIIFVVNLDNLNRSLHLIQEIDDDILIAMNLEKFEMVYFNFFHLIQEVDDNYCCDLLKIVML